MKTCLISVAVFFICVTSFAQVGIGTTTPNASAKLDITASDKGFLPPRVSLTSASDNSTVPSPAIGLLVFCTGSGGLTSGYYYWNGTLWASLGGGSNLYTSDGTLTANRTVSTASGYTLTLNPKTTFSQTLSASSRSAIGTSFSPTLTASSNNDVLVGVDINPTLNTNSKTGVATYGLRVQGIGIGTGPGSNSSFNTAVGAEALKINSSGLANVAFAKGTLAANTTGSTNTAIGYNALNKNVSGDNSTAIGSTVLANSNGSSGPNTAIGSEAMNSTNSGYSNTGVGYQVMKLNTTGYGNTALGEAALYSSTVSPYNVAIGHSALQYFIPTSSSFSSIGIGYRALSGTSAATPNSGNNNVAIGYAANSLNTTGNYNVSM